ncbi:HNH endonuclease [Nocardioides sp. MAH-18]|uniref:HNH endonuclease n=1 Tax=Nocardioides agri TaxID=2682843 RepID=A0A6L6XX54_9ACTN|nr:MULTISPECIES: HNH endonuclease [unclassified Nocardioides]MBA2952196.1 HNH endonuclease [Nocardioides sp. CGMCC 1.13656]MVQ51362.1 HNH endonuclease [Nocardioides sp. MAH-18]
MPLLMSPPHPSATGSYGELAAKWAEAELGLRLRWWQRLALRRLLEHDAEGSLCWTTALVSTPRRAGKSTLLMVLALWRISHGDLFGEPVQSAIHCAADKQAVAEVMRKSFGWAQTNGHAVRRANGQEAVELTTGGRWLLRSTSAVYGYEVDLGIVDEAWAVDPETVDDGLEPGLAHRPSPQLLVTSTAHRRATSLMRRRLAAATAGMGEDTSTLVLLWGAPADAPLGEVGTWRAASPFWTVQVERLISDRWERVQRGEADPAADDPDPVEGFAAQYLNRWPPTDAVPVRREEPAVPAELWTGALTEDGTPSGRPAVAALESWFAVGPALAVAWVDEAGRAVVSARQADTLADAADLVRTAGAPVLLVGKSLTDDAALTTLAGSVTIEPTGGTTWNVVSELRRYLDEGRLRHDGSPLLADQVAGLVVVDAATGPRLRPGAVVSAVKAAVWAARRALAATEPPRIF